MITQEEIKKAANDWRRHPDTCSCKGQYRVPENELAAFIAGANFALSKQQAECDELRRKLGIANKLIAKFHPDNGFIFEDGSEDLEQMVMEYFISDKQLNKPTEGGGE
jgi:hypothetical protein